jgi:hypothetical protein
MPRIEVDPGQLHSAGGTQAALAAQIGSLCAGVQAAGDGAAVGAGEGVAMAAIMDCTGAWTAGLGMIAQSVGTLASNLGAAGSAYLGTDLNAIPGAGP